MWQVSIRFFGPIAARLGDHRVVEIQPGSRVDDLLHLLDLREDDVSLCIVNQTQVGPDSPLSDGAEVMFIPVIVGG